MSTQWKHYPLSSLSQMRMGETLIKSNLTGYGKPIFSAGKSEKPWAFTERTKLSFHQGSLVVGARGTLGSVKLPEFDEFTSTQTTIVVTPNENILPKFLYFFFKTFDFSKIKEGVGIPMISIKNFQKVSIPLPIDKNGKPDLNEQKRIVTILEEAEELKKKRALADQKMSVLAQALFIKMFGEPTVNPMAWKTAKAGAFLKIKSGFAFKSKDFVQSGVPLLKIGTINKGYFDLDSLCYLPEDYSITYKSFIINPGELLITLTGTSGKDDYGNVFVVSDEYKKYLLNQRVAKLEMDDLVINKEYFFYFLSGKSVKKLIIKNNRGVRQGNINNTDLLNLIVPLPPIELQNKFCERIKEIEVQKEKQKQSSDKIDEIFQTLLSRTFSGNI